MKTSQNGSFLWVLQQIYALVFTPQLRRSYGVVLLVECIAYGMITLQGLVPGLAINAYNQYGWQHAMYWALIFGGLDIVGSFVFTNLRRHLREIVVMDVRGRIDLVIEELFGKRPMLEHLSEGISTRFALVEKGRPALEEMVRTLMFTGSQIFFGISACILGLWIINPLAGLVVTICMSIAGIYLYKIHTWVIAGDAKIEPEFKRYNALWKETLKQMATVQLYCREAIDRTASAQRFHDWVLKDRKLWIQFIRYLTVSDPLIMNSIVYGVVLLSLWQAGHNMLSIGMLFPTIMWTKDIARHMGAFGDMSHGLLRHHTYASVMLAELQRPHDIHEPEHPHELTEITELRLDHVDYTYMETGRPVLRNVQARFMRGQLTAIVGPTGGGKTTIIKLLMRAADPNGGCVRANGHCLPTLTLHSFRSRIGYVPQHPMPWEATIRQNLAKPHTGICPSDEEMLRVLKLCGLDLRDKHKARFSEGLDTRVGEDGVLLSGGEKQRLMIATAVLSGKDFIIFDEPTSALDAKTEEVIKDVFQTLKSLNVGIIVIAHRLSTISDADQICVLHPVQECDEGEDQLRSYASCDEAQRNNPLFKTLWDAHHGNFIEE